MLRTIAAKFAVVPAHRFLRLHRHYNAFARHALRLCGPLAGVLFLELHQLRRLQFVLLPQFQILMLT